MDGVSADLLKATTVMHITMNTSSKASQDVNISSFFLAVKVILTLPTSNIFRPQVCLI
jgi:hypothetical protein